MIGPRKTFEKLSKINFKLVDTFNNLKKAQASSDLTINHVLILLKGKRKV